MRENPKLIHAVKAAKKACAIIATLAKVTRSGNCSRDHRKVFNIWESLRSRAREAPSLLATWGPAGTIIFYASKAISIDSGILNELMKYAVFNDYCLENVAEAFRNARNMSEVGTGYAIYLASITSYLAPRHALERPAREGAVKLLDELINKAVKGEVKMADLLYGVETVSRLIQIFGDPVIDEAEKKAKENRYCEALRIIEKKLPEPGEG